MNSTTVDDPIATKARELCQTIIDQPGFSELRAKLDAFMNDELLKFQFQLVNQKGEILAMKQGNNMPLDGQEIMEFEKLRDEFIANPIAKNFLDAQNEVSRIQSQVGQLLSKTFELGRVPTDEDMDDGSCCNNEGCGCS
jgi:cell fate (sporulation/competence/biofilm development) regulator YlbF (YheA/YmcA/DUF963 family)